MSGAPAVKRRKPSMMSTGSSLSVHPLRQTSFPPDGNDVFSPEAIRSPSVETMSLVSSSIAGAPVKKKRGRKPKGAEDTASLAGEVAPTAMSGVSGRGRASRGMSAEEDDDAGGDMDVAIVSRTKEEKEKEKQHRAMLVTAFDEMQFRRYEHWRQARLSDAVVRRVISNFLGRYDQANMFRSSSTKHSHNPFLPASSWLSSQ
jgi:transcription initiation factor TFIID subunit 11